MGSCCCSGEGDEDAHRKGIAPRTCTDFCCGVLFFLFLGGMALITHYAIRNGDDRRLTHGYNWDGELCGVDPGQENSPFLFWCRSLDPPVGMPSGLLLDRPICVPTCPRNFTAQVLCPREPEVTSQKATVASATNKYTVVSQVTQPTDAYPSEVFADRFCLPSFDWKHEKEAKLKYAIINNPKSSMSSVGVKIMLGVSGLMNVKMLFAGVALGAVLASYLYLLLLKCAAKYMIYLAWGLLAAVLLLIGLALGSTAFDLTGHQEDSPLFMELPHDQAVAISAIAALVFLGAAMGVMCFLTRSRDSIKVANQCIEAACECMFGMCQMLIYPLFGAVLKIVLAAALMWIFELLLTCGTTGSEDGMTVQEEGVTGLSRKFDFTNQQKGYILYYGLGYYWIMNFVNSVGWFVISYATFLWYFEPGSPKATPAFPCIRGFCAGTFYHLGTLALGSLLITVTRWFRMILGFVMGEVEAAEETSCGKVIKPVCCCCIFVYERLVAPFTRAAYIEVALNSVGFVTAANESFEFIFHEEGSKIAALSGATALFEVVGSLSIGCSGGYITYMVVTNVERYTSDTSDHYVSDPVFVSFVAGFVCYQIATVFLDVLDQCSETLLYAYSHSLDSGKWKQCATEALKKLVGEPPVVTLLQEVVPEVPTMEDVQKVEGWTLPGFGALKSYVGLSGKSA